MLKRRGKLIYERRKNDGGANLARFHLKTEGFIFTQVESLSSPLAMSFLVINTITTIGVILTHSFKLFTYICKVTSIRDVKLINFS